MRVPDMCMCAWLVCLSRLVCYAYLDWCHVGAPAPVAARQAVRGEGDPPAPDRRQGGAGTQGEGGPPAPREQGDRRVPEGAQAAGV